MKVRISENDLFGYADDVLIICDDVEMVKRTINTIRVWYNSHNMRLNEKKSGVVEFFGRRMKSVLAEKDVCNFPTYSVSTNI